MPPFAFGLTSTCIINGESCKNTVAGANNDKDDDNGGVGEDDDEYESGYTKMFVFAILCAFISSCWRPTLPGASKWDAKDAPGLPGGYSLQFYIQYISVKTRVVEKRWTR